MTDADQAELDRLRADNLALGRLLAEALARETSQRTANEVLVDALKRANKDQRELLDALADARRSIDAAAEGNDRL